MIVWVLFFVDCVDVEELEDEFEVGDVVILYGIYYLDDYVVVYLCEVVFWLKLGCLEVVNVIYWVNYCQICGVLQGDYFVMGVNGLFFFQFCVEVDVFEFIFGCGVLSVNVMVV